jgi:hypothetical protein
VTPDDFFQAIQAVGQLGGPFAATIAAISGIISATRSHKNGKAIEGIHISINSRLSKLLELTEQSALARGVLQERTRHGDIDAEVSAQDARALRQAGPHLKAVIEPDQL